MFYHCLMTELNRFYCFPLRSMKISFHLLNAVVGYSCCWLFVCCGLKRTRMPLLLQQAFLAVVDLIRWDSEVRHLQPLELDD